MIGAPNRAGFHRKNCREKINAWFNNRHSKYISTSKHIIDLCLSQLSVLGDFHPQTEFKLAIRAEDERVAETFISENRELIAKPIVGINAGAGFPTKIWSIERYAQLADKLVEELGFSILLTWGPGEKEMTQKIAKNMKQKSWVAPVTTIAESIGLYKKLSLFVGSDSGPFHICCCIGYPNSIGMGANSPRSQRSIYK